MPQIIDYDAVLEQMQRQALQSLYYNSGAFGFADRDAVIHRGWIGPPDATLRPAAVAMARQVIEPCAPHLADLAVQAWQQVVGGSVWVMPMSHWAYELDFGSSAWLPTALQQAGIDPDSLRPRTNAAALAFAPAETSPFQALVLQLLENLTASDFALAFPGSPILCTLHHHQQLWWTTTDHDLLARLDAHAAASTLLAPA